MHSIAQPLADQAPRTKPPQKNALASRVVAWKKSPPELIAAFEKAKPSDPNVQSRPMFGYPSVFLNGNHFAGTFQDKIVARLSETDRERALKAGTKQFAPMPGRPMKEYVVVPAADVAKPAALAKWVAQAHTYAKTLPAKEKKKKPSGGGRGAAPAKKG